MKRENIDISNLTFGQPISTEIALTEIEPIEWSDEVVNGRRQVIIRPEEKTMNKYRDITVIPQDYIAHFIITDDIESVSRYGDYRYVVKEECLPLIRCKDCKWSYIDERDNTRWCEVHMTHYRTDDNGFCNLGERID